MRHRAGGRSSRARVLRRMAGARVWRRRWPISTRSAERRADVRRVLPSARSVIVVAAVYNTDRPYSTECADPVARARGALRLGRRLPRGDRIAARGAARVDARAVARAVRSARLRRHGPGAGARLRAPCRHRVDRQEHLRHQPRARIVDLSRRDHLQPGARADEPALDQCGTCTLCLEACPTQALVAPGVLDSNRCISYLTIEHRGAIDAALADGIGSHVYGCDICQEVCPWNATAPTSDDPAWQPRPGLGSAVARRPRPDAGRSPAVGARRAAPWSARNPPACGVTSRLRKRTQARARTDRFVNDLRKVARALSS